MASFMQMHVTVLSWGEMSLTFHYDYITFQKRIGLFIIIIIIV
jgi:hypothetical protein